MMGHAFSDTITHRKGPAWGVDAMDEYGQPNGATQSIGARVEPTTRRVMGSDGEDHQAAFEVYTGAEVRVGDVLTISGQDHVVMLSAAIRDLAGTVDHWELVC